MKLNALKTYGQSMYPLFQNEDIVFIKKVSFIKLQVNDVVVITRNKKYITHRIVFKNNKYIITKGDNNPYPDTKSLPSQVIGKVEEVKRGDTRLNVNMIYLIQSTTYFSELLKIKKELEKECIDFVFLKGLPIHLYYEKAHPRRVYVDCDLSIKKENFSKLKMILVKHGYQLKDTHLFQNKRMQADHPEVSFTKHINKIPVTFDIHFEAVFLMTQFNITNFLYNQKLLEQFSNNLLKNKRIVTISNEEFPILEHNYLIVYLVLHIFHHNFRGFYRYELLQKVLLNNQTDYKVIFKIISKYKLIGFTKQVFQIAKRFYTVPVPPNFLKDNNQCKVLLTEVLTDQTKVESGIERFKLIFYASPNRFYKKILILTNRELVKTIIKILYKKTIWRLKSFYPIKVA